VKRKKLGVKRMMDDEMIGAVAVQKHANAIKSSDTP
jgi:hypothetical protein